MIGLLATGTSTSQPGKICVPGLDCRIIYPQSESARRLGFVRSIDYGTLLIYRQALSGVYVNLVNLFECWETKERPYLFPSRKALLEYSKKGRTFNREIVKQDQVLRSLMRHIL